MQKKRVIGLVAVILFMFFLLVSKHYIKGILDSHESAQSTLKSN